LAVHGSRETGDGCQMICLSFIREYTLYYAADTASIFYAEQAFTCRLQAQAKPLVSAPALGNDWQTVFSQGPSESYEVDGSKTGESPGGDGSATMVCRLRECGFEYFSMGRLQTGASA
jgi:hypothetical protein